MRIQDTETILTHGLQFAVYEHQRYKDLETSFHRHIWNHLGVSNRFVALLTVDFGAAEFERLDYRYFETIIILALRTVDVVGSVVYFYDGVLNVNDTAGNLYGDRYRAVNDFVPLSHMRLNQGMAILDSSSERRSKGVRCANGCLRYSDANEVVGDDWTCPSCQQHLNKWRRFSLEHDRPLNLLFVTFWPKVWPKTFPSRLSSRVVGGVTAAFRLRLLRLEI